MNSADIVSLGESLGLDAVGVTRAEAYEETERTIVERKAEGYSTAEVAQRTGWKIRQIQRFLKSLHDSIPGSGG